MALQQYYSQDVNALVFHWLIFGVDDHTIQIPSLLCYSNLLHMIPSYPPPGTSIKAVLGAHLYFRSLLINSPSSHHLENTTNKNNAHLTSNHPGRPLGHTKHRHFPTHSNYNHHSYPNTMRSCSRELLCST